MKWSETYKERWNKKWRSIVRREFTTASKKRSPTAPMRIHDQTPMVPPLVCDALCGILMMMQPTQAQLDELVQRIVTTVHPMRIILFGSAVRGEMTQDSDLDVLVVMPEGTNRRHTAQELHRHFFGLSFPVDIIVTTPSLLERHHDNIGLIYRTILREGRELYAA